jgi:hypothetical protein
MNNLGDIYNQVVFLLGKDKIGGYVSPDKFNEALKYVNTSYMNMLVSEFEKTKSISNSLRGLIKTLGGAINPPLALDDYGYGDIPSDLRYEVRSAYNQFYNSSCAGEKQYRSVEFVSQAEWDHRHDVQMYHPTKEEPIWCFEGGKIRVSPILPSFQFTYIRYGATPVFDYDIIDEDVVYLPVGAVHENDLSGHLVGSESESVEFEYPIEDYDKLVQMLVRYFAVGNREQFNLQATA